MACKVLLTQFRCEQITVPSELGFSLQDLQLRIDTSVETCASITQAHQRRLHRCLTNANPLVCFLQIEVGGCRVETKVPQGNEVGVAGLLESITS